MEKHSLRREIIATQITNSLVNDMGITFVQRLQEQTGAEVAAVVRAYVVAQQVFGGRDLITSIEALDHKIPVPTQLDMMLRVNRLMRRTTRWFLRTCRSCLDITKNIAQYQQGVSDINQQLMRLLSGTALHSIQATRQPLVDAGVPKSLAERIASGSYLAVSLDIISAAKEHGFDINVMAQTYFILGEQLELDWLRGQLMSQRPVHHWDSMARTTLRDDLDWLQRGLTIAVLLTTSAQQNVNQRITQWREQHTSLAARWHSILADLRRISNLEFVVFYVVVRELLDVTQASLQQVKHSHQHKLKDHEK